MMDKKPNLDCFVFLFFCYVQVEKDNSRMKAGGRMFRVGLEEEVFKLDTGGLLVGKTAEEFR